MTACDTGPLIALIDPRQGEVHSRCAECLRRLRGPLVVTWPVVTESTYFAGKLGGWPLQNLLWTFLENRDAFQIHVPLAAEVEWMRALMERYRDTPMDLADAAIVAASETLKIRQVFTLDNPFRAYRARDGGAFLLLPD